MSGSHRGSCSCGRRLIVPSSTTGEAPITCECGRMYWFRVPEGEEIKELISSHRLTERAIDAIRKERARQDVKWGRLGHDAGEWLLILSEEIGEVAEAVLAGIELKTMHELIQVAAVAVAWLEDVMGAVEQSF